MFEPIEHSRWNRAVLHWKSIFTVWTEIRIFIPFYVRLDSKYVNISDEGTGISQSNP